mmetsp:Transcript_14336/g.27474  ORF Transcript_14336/g.27474 Transcript_14336/m.27474 type:complete len:243 (-) Transcript_14336:267-995(-)
MLQNLGYRRALSGVDGEDLLEKVLHISAEVRGELVLARHNLLSQMMQLQLVERQMPGQHCKQDDAARPDVHRLALVAVLLEHLGGHEVGGATEGVEHAVVLVRVRQRTQPKVGNHELAFLVHQQVLRLEVPVSNALGVAPRQPVQQPLEVRARLRLLHLPPRLPHLPAPEQLQHEVDVIVGGEHLLQVHNARVLDHLENGHLALQPHDVVGAQALLLNDLHSEGFSSLQMRRHSNLSKGSLA